MADKMLKVVSFDKLFGVKTTCAKEGMNNFEKYIL